MADALLDGKVALVTGGGSGIGRATALAFAREGCAGLLVADRDEAGGEETVRLVREQSPRTDATFVATEVTRAADADAMVAAAVERWGRLDCAHNNAGISLQGPSFHELDERSFDLVISVNVKGVWLGMRSELRQMLAQGYGSIVNTASAASIIGTPGNPAYAASKHAVMGLTRTAAMEHVRDNIRVNAVCPGAIRTPLITRFLDVDPGIVERVTKVQPGGRLGEPEEVAEAVVWLSSDRASFVTGEGMLVDGGAVSR
ncbi:MAG TPA: glucose 1-dehydrogenase [Acidimicrobiia bacterium]|nr:glucose 1-dehydrogenase [Acidimicrobiia bacterium]